MGKMINIDTKDAKALMIRCQIGAGGRDTLGKVHLLLAECYDTIGALVADRDRLSDWLKGDAECPCCTQMDICEPDCTYSKDCSTEAFAMETVRSVLRGPVI